MSWNGAKVSVIIPVHNGATYLRDAIESAQRQTLQPSEIIVVDDGSTDDSSTIARESGRSVRCLRQKHAGVAAARNCGIGAAQGDYVAFLDADDLWPVDKLSGQLVALDADPSAELVFGRIQCLKPAEGEGALYSPFGRPWSWCLLGAALIRRAVFDRTGPFDSSLAYGEDLEWFSRVLEHGVRVTQMERVCLLYRMHGANLTRGIPHSSLGLTRILKLHLDRQRATDRSLTAGEKP